MDISVDVEPTTPPEEEKEKDADKGKDKEGEEEVEVKPIERIRYKSPPKMAAAGLGLTRK